jgi:integrase
MASISNSGGRRTIQIVGEDGKRRPVRLGKCDGRTALAVKFHVERMIESKSLGMPLHADTIDWLRSVNDEFHNRLSNAGLCDARDGNRRGAMPLKKMLDSYIARRTDMKLWSIKMLQQARNKLIGFFGEDKPIGTITVADAADFKRHVGNDVSTAYVAKLVMLSRQFFRDAVDRELLEKSPFARLKAGSQKNAARQQFISRETIELAMKSAPNLEWKLIIALARYGGLRIPSETVPLRWTDVNFETGKIHIRSSKTAHHPGHESRNIPMFPELESLLRRARAEASADAVFVIPTYRDPMRNLRTPFLHILTKAGTKPWPKLFQNLRSTRQTELTESFPAHVVCGWMGNSERVAQGHYLQVTEDHFAKAIARKSNSDKEDKNDDGDGGEGKKGGAESGAVGAGFASQYAAPQFLENAVRGENADTNDNMPAGAGMCESGHLGATGFEPVKAEPADLQSAPFGHLGTRPKLFLRRLATGR